MAQDIERRMAIFPRDTVKIITAAYCGATEILIDAYPEHNKTSEGLQAVAEDNYDTFKRYFYTDDPQLLKWLFMESFMNGYDLTGSFFDEKPEVYRELAALSEDERTGFIEALFAAWYETRGKNIEQLAERRK